MRRSRQSNYAFGITPPSNNRLGASLPRQAIVVSRSDGTTAEAVCNLPALMQHLGQSVPGNGRLGVVQLATSELEADSSAGGSNGGQRVPHFPRGSGVLEMSNAFILFVNVPSTAYPNAFSVREDTSTGEAVCEMSWWSSKGQTVNHPVMRRLLGPAVRALLPAQTSASGSEEGEEVEHVDEPARAVLLFCRPLKEAYVLCGRLEASEVEECEDGRLRVEWRLMDFGSLRTSAHFQRVMQLQAGVV